MIITASDNNEESVGAVPCTARDDNHTARENHSVNPRPAVETVDKPGDPVDLPAAVHDGEAAAALASLPVSGEPTPTKSTTSAQSPALSSSGEQPALTPVQRKRLRWVVAKFVAGWLTFLLAIAIITMLTNVEWARPKVEQAMSQSFHRRVHLGYISWTLGMNGLGIATDKLAMVEKDGLPFIIAGRSEIGVAFLPLFQRKVIVKHVDFHRPEVFATQVAPGKWNFSDLLVEGPEIHYVEVDDGKLHLRNLVTQEQLAHSDVHTMFANTNWKRYDFENVQWKLIFPKKKQQRQWPFYLSFKLPRKGGPLGPYTSSFSITVLANGHLDDWQKKKCTIEISGKDINPDDWRPFLKIPQGLDGLFEYQFRGKGVVADGITGDIKCGAKQLAVNNGTQTLLKAPDASCTADLTISPTVASWQNLQFTVGGVGIDSHGQISDWNKQNPHYSAVIAANLHDLSELSHTSLWQFLPGATDQNKEKLAGAAVVEVRLEGDEKEQNVYTSLQAHDIPLSNLLASQNKGAAPFLSMFQVQPTAPIRGQIEVDKNTVAFDDVQIPVKGSVLHVDGYIDGTTHKHEIKIDAKDLPLDRFDTRQLEGQVPPRSANPHAVVLTGKVDLDANILGDGRKNTIDVQAQLKDCSVTAGQKDLIAKGLHGNLTFDGSVVRLNKLEGLLADSDGKTGSFGLNGAVSGGKNGICNLDFIGSRVDVNQLVNFTRSAQIPIPSDAVEPMHGIARELDIHVRGPASGPNLSLRLLPEDNLYQFGPAKGKPLKPLRVTAGSIIWANNTLDMKDLAITSQTGKIYLTAQFAGQGNDLVPKSIKVKSNGIDISEVQDYLNSSTMAEQSRKSFAAMVDPLHLSGVQGKTYGELTINPDGGMEGVVSISDGSGKLGSKKVPFDKLNGVITANPNEMYIQDITANYGASKISFKGSVRNYTQSPNWKITLNGQMRPQDLSVTWPDAFQIDDTYFSSNGPMELHATITGEQATCTNRVVLSMKADPSDGIRWHTPFCNFVQPTDAPISVDSTLILACNDKPNLKIESAKLVVGSSTLQGSGLYSWSNDGRKMPTFNATVTTPTTVPADFLAMMIGLPTTSGMSGTVKGMFTCNGPIDKLQAQADLNLYGVSIAGMNIKDAQGTLHVPKWIISAPGDGSESQAHIALSELQLNGLPMKNLKADYLLENDAEPKISMTNGSANVAEGNVAMNGFYLPKSQKWHWELSLAKLQINQFFQDLIEHSGEITGLADGKISLDGVGVTTAAAVPTLNGHGQIAIYKGTAPRVAQLQEKLTQANFLKQGIFGFNLNNALQSLLPVKAGKFREASVHFDVNSGVVSLERVNFDGNDLRLRAAGDWNIPLNTVSIAVAGDIPRVSSSLLPGKVGEVSKQITLQKAFRMVTFRKLEALPSFPILGDIAADQPRAFAFKVVSSLSSPDAVTHSIQRSFHWLPNKANASAHPIPGLNI